MLRAVATAVIIILNVRWWSWAHLCCTWKLPNVSYRVHWMHFENTTACKWRKIRITKCKKILSSIGEDPEWKIRFEDFYKEKR